MGMSLYGDEEGKHEYLMNSLGVSYRMNEEGIWFVKIPIEDGEPKKENATIAVVEDDVLDHEERPSEEVPQKAIEELIDWYVN